MPAYGWDIRPVLQEKSGNRLSMAIESSYFLVRRRKISSILEALGGRINKDHLSAIANRDGGMIIATAVYYGFTPKNEKQYYTAMHYMANVSLYMYHSMSDDNLYILITKNREQVTINIIGAVWYIATACLASVYNKLISKLGANSNKSMSKKAGRHTACGLKIILQLKS